MRTCSWAITKRSRRVDYFRHGDGLWHGLPGGNTPHPRAHIFGAIGLANLLDIPVISANRRPAFDVTPEIRLGLSLSIGGGWSHEPKKSLVPAFLAGSSSPAWQRVRCRPGS